MNCIIFDLDQTIADTSKLSLLRRQQKWSEVYKNLFQIQIYPNIYDVISALRKRSYKIGIVTNSPKQYCKNVIDFLSLDIDNIVGYHSTILKKPFPEPILYCIDQLGKDFKNIYGVGDSQNDILSYKNSKIKSIGCLWGNEDNKKLIDENPDYIVSAPLEILNIIN